MSEELKLTEDQFLESVEAYEKITRRYWLPTDAPDQALFIKAVEFGIKLASKSSPPPDKDEA